MITDEIREKLYVLQDVKYRDFQSGLIPEVSKDAFIGVRTPELRKLAKDFSLREDADEFLNDLPHRFFDENQLHAFMISGIKDINECREEVEQFLPYVDNWATCDQLSPKVFGKYKKELLEFIREWLGSDRTYTIRFGLRMLMQHFLDDDFDPAYLDMTASIHSEEYYVKMMIAWYFATALAKQYDAALPYIEEKRLDKWTHNKTIRKAIESYRVTDEHKAHLRELSIR